MPCPSHARLPHKELRVLSANRGRGKKRRSEMKASRGGKLPPSTTTPTTTPSWPDDESSDALSSVEVETGKRQADALHPLSPTTTLSLPDDESCGALSSVEVETGKQQADALLPWHMYADATLKPSADCSTSKLPGSSVLLMPSSGQKLGRMLSLIHHEDAQFQHHPFYTQMDFPAKKGARVMQYAKARRLRSLLALAHHLDEQDPYLKLPGRANLDTNQSHWKSA